jgi:hypothetical protein
MAAGPGEIMNVNQPAAYLKTYPQTIYRLINRNFHYDFLLQDTLRAI